MRIVPIGRVLIQPTVQLGWLKQHGQIEFALDTAVQQQFMRIWTDYRKAGRSSLVTFLNHPETDGYQLYENDVLFALLTGADYISNIHPDLCIRACQPNLIWTLPHN